MNANENPTPTQGKLRIRVRGTATFIREGDEVRDFEFQGQHATPPADWTTSA